MSTTQTQLAILTDATRMLSQIRTVDDARNLVDLAEAARVYAEKARLGDEAVNYATEIKIRAQRAGGLILQKMPKNKGAAATATRSHDGTALPPTLADLEISKNDSSRWQAIASIPEVELEAYIVETKAESSKLSTNGVVTLAKKKASGIAKDAARKEKQQTRIESSDPHTDSVLWQGDMREVGSRIADNSVDLIVTDPPYPFEYIERFSDLSALAARVLKPGALCCVYSGQMFLPEVIARLSENLTYIWALAIKHAGGNQRIWKVNLNAGWKPVLLYVKPPLDVYWDSFIDITSGAREKDDHPWQQAEAEAAYFIEHLCPTDGLVLDPFAGSGTVLQAAQRLSRRYIGIEINPDTVETAERKLSK